MHTPLWSLTHPPPMLTPLPCGHPGACPKASCSEVLRVTHHLEPLATWSHSSHLLLGVSHRLEPLTTWSHKPPEASLMPLRPPEVPGTTPMHAPKLTPKLAPKLINCVAPLPSPRPLSSIRLSNR